MKSHKFGIYLTPPHSVKHLYKCHGKFRRMGRKISRTLSMPNLLSVFVDKAEFRVYLFGQEHNREYLQMIIEIMQ